MLNIKLIKVLLEFGIFFLTTIMFNPVMAGGDDDYCQCNLEKSERNSSNHIYLCPSSNMYDKELCLNEEVQLSGFLEQLTEDLGEAELYEAMATNEKIATPDQAAIIALHTNIKENMRGDLCMSICSQNIFMRYVNSVRQMVMEKISVLDIELCPLSTQELSEIIYFTCCVVSPFSMSSENIRDDFEYKILMFACKCALDRWCSVYGKKAPTTKQERIIFHALVIAFCLLPYVEKCECYVANNVNKMDSTSKLSTQYNYFLSIMQSLKDRYSDNVLNTSYLREEDVKMVHSFIEIDDYEDNLDELRNMVFGNISGFILQSRSISRKTFLDFIVIKDGEDTKIRTLITPGLYWLDSSTVNFEKDVKVLLSSIPLAVRISDIMAVFFKAGVEIGMVICAALIDFFMENVIDFVARQ
ncbi:MAG: hypothetical protein QS748_07360 [Candidatus Endonucleobacter bathymodioli]|uniref:Uncharacterized protein n=1 Tax=Candidatus Endonucleibacter bathymodioli TaxID=539814 RepID=A0AA90SMM7_9GAMM|nr:hypothetical protein [Candidatus Endonucleobacter bathymodioli]